jgi:uncharacterized protein (TIGR02646 family)
MRFLDRKGVDAPACLSQYQHGQHDWSALATNSTHYQDVCTALEALQGERCAYCECDLSKESVNPHVEHFFQRSRFPGQTFSWGNLFRSCTHRDRCGKLKDENAGNYEDAHLIKPDVTDPHGLLHFATDGRVRARLGLSDGDRRRATETIRVFGLDCGSLRGTRRQYLKAVISEREQAEAAGFSDAELSAYLQLVAQDYAGQPFSSALLDALGL